MTIDKQALREAAEKATRGPWEMERENIWFTDEDGYTKHLAYVQQGDDVDDKQDHYNTAFIAAFNPKVALALLDEVESAEHTSAVDHEAACSLVEENEELKRRIAELEARTVTLPQQAPENLASVLDGYEKWLIATTFRDTWNACLAEVTQMNAAGIKVKGE
ncbi:ead/Ea22-like family protein [Salmonella enterica]